MIILQMTGLSGAGKSTIALGAKALLEEEGYKIEVLDGDVYRKNVFPNLGFSKEDRNQNINSLFYLAKRFAEHGVISIMSAINPYEKIRMLNSIDQESIVKTVYIQADMDTLIKRDTKGLYKRAYLKPKNPLKIHNLSGVNDPYDIPQSPDLTINTNNQAIEESVKVFCEFVLEIVESKNLIP
jgi:adenylylsulfate kinase